MSLFSSDVPVAGPYAPSCSSRTADGALRGVLVGWCWTAAFRDDASPAMHDGRAVAKPPSLARVTLKNSAGFAAFLGAFAAATCFCERTRRADDAWNKVFGGAVAGAVAGARAPLSLRVVTTSAGWTAAVVGGVFFLAEGRRGGGGTLGKMLFLVRIMISREAGYWTPFSTQTTTKTTMPTSGLP